MTAAQLHHKDPKAVSFIMQTLSSEYIHMFLVNCVCVFARTWVDVQVFDEMS